LQLGIKKQLGTPKQQWTQNGKLINKQLGIKKQLGTPKQQWTQNGQLITKKQLIKPLPLPQLLQPLPLLEIVRLTNVHRVGYIKVKEDVMEKIKH